MTSPLPPLRPNDFTPDEAPKTRPSPWERNDAFTPVLSQARRLDDRQTGPRPPVPTPADRHEPSRDRSMSHAGPNPGSASRDAAQPDRPRSHRADAGSAGADAGDTRTARSEKGDAERDEPATAGSQTTSASTGSAEATGSEAAAEEAVGHGGADPADVVEGEASDQTADGLSPPTAGAAAGGVDEENPAESVVSSAVDASASSLPTATQSAEAHLLAEPPAERPTSEPEVETATAGTDGTDSPESAEAEPSEPEPDQLTPALDDRSVRAGQPALVDLAASTAGATAAGTTPGETAPGETSPADSIGPAQRVSVTPAGPETSPNPGAGPAIGLPTDQSAETASPEPTSSETESVGLIRTNGPSSVNAGTEGSSTTVGADQLASRVEGRGVPTTAEASAASADNAADSAADELWAQVQRALHRVRTGPDGAELRLRLHPAELGELLVQVRTHGDQLAVRLVASSTAAQQTLLADQQRLAAELAEAGFAEGAVDISQSGTGTFGDDRPSGGDEATSSDPTDAHSPSIPGSSAGAEQALVDANRNGRRHTGLVDLTL